MRKSLSILALSAALAAIHGPPVQAQSSATGCYKVVEDPSTKVCTQMRAVSATTAMGFTILLRSDGSWSYGDLTLDLVRNTDRILLQGDLTAVAGGQTLGGTYKSPDPSRSTAAGRIWVDFYRYETEYLIGLRRILRDELVTGGAMLGGPAGSPPAGWYVPQIVNPDATLGQLENGTGVFVQYEGDKLRLVIASYLADGSPRWFSVTGTCVVNGNGVCTYTAPVVDPQFGALSETMSVTQSSNNVEFSLSGHPLDSGVRRRLTPQQF